MIPLLKKNWIVVVAALLAAVFLLAGRVTPAAAIASIDVDLLLVLFALLVAVEILRESGYLDLAVAMSMRQFTSTRAFALSLLLCSGLLACLVTNDVALFVIIPFTIVAGRFSKFDVENAVVLEIIAANLLGCLTPLGNPQNLFIFHRSGWSMPHFLTTMFPFVGLSAVGLLLALFFLVPAQPMEQGKVSLPPRAIRPAVAGAVTFALVLLEISRVIGAMPAAVSAAVAAAIFLRRRFFAIDLSIVPLFLCAFIVVEGMRSLQLGRFGSHLYLTAVVISQVISNVPAAVLLSPLATGQWKDLLYGVSAGGCGTIIASLANLLGWRIYTRESGRDRRFFWRLTAVNLGFLIWAGGGGWLLLKFA